MSDTTAYPVTPVNRVKRLHERGAYDRATVHAILDAAALCHIAYVVDGQPYCTPTLFWREGDRLYWHGSSASRMLRDQSEGEPVCVTVSHLDGLVLARSGFNHSVDYRSAMAFGHARVVDDPDEKIARARRDDRPLLSRPVGDAEAGDAAGDQGDAGDRHDDRAGLREGPRQGDRRRRGGLRPADLRRAHPGAAPSSARPSPARASRPASSGPRRSRPIARAARSTMR